MYKFLTGLFILLLICGQNKAQILPKEGSVLNYRIVGFSFPEGKPARDYTIEVAVGSFYNEDSFKQNITKTFTSDSSAIIRELPFFGVQYTWRVVYHRDRSDARHPLHHFRVGTYSTVDTNNMRLRILKPAETYKDAYVFMDGTKALYDMKGNPLWFLPVVNEIPADKIWGFGDLNVTPQGTITYLTTPRGGQVFEADFNGNILWKGPNNGKISRDTIEYYNHEFVRFPNGHYMVLGGEYLWYKLPRAIDTSIMNRKEYKGNIRKDSNNNFYQKLRFGTVIEYDEQSNVVWYWRAADYFEKSDVYDHTTPMGTFDIENVHENSFYFDEKNKVIYIGFRDISRVLKVQYPEGKVTAVYGSIHKPSDHGYDNKLFYHQHSVRISADGYLYMYNNNNRRKGSLPTLAMFRMPASEKDTLEKIWEYECPIDGFDTTMKEVPNFSALGSVVELPDRSLLACMTANNYTRVFIVNRDKQVLWSAIPELYSTVYKKWHPVTQYRAQMIIDKAELEMLIWNAEKWYK